MKDLLSMLQVPFNQHLDTRKWQENQKSEVRPSDKWPKRLQSPSLNFSDNQYSSSNNCHSQSLTPQATESQISEREQPPLTGQLLYPAMRLKSALLQPRNQKVLILFYSSLNNSVFFLDIEADICTRKYSKVWVWASVFNFLSFEFEFKYFANLLRI